MNAVETFVAFHGTSLKNANNIVNSHFKVNKKRKNEWLGYGIYFFMYEEDALSWAKKTYYSKYDPCILECILKIDRNDILDLDNPKHNNLFKRFCLEVESELRRFNKSLTFEDKFHKMCYFLNLYKEEYSIRLVKYTFKNRRTKNALGYKDIELGYEYNEKQICLTNEKANELVSKRIKYIK